jgi:hypothetical protein
LECHVYLAFLLSDQLILKQESFALNFSISEIWRKEKNGRTVLSCTEVG